MRQVFYPKPLTTGRARADMQWLIVAAVVSTPFPVAALALSGFLFPCCSRVSRQDKLVIMRKHSIEYLLPCPDV
jgi:hypothetical protein